MAKQSHSGTYYTIYYNIPVNSIKSRPRHMPTPAKKITPIAKTSKTATRKATTAQIEGVLVKVRPYIQMHGGDVELVGVEKGIVTLNIQGACAHCRMADLTYNNLIAGLLKEEVPGIKDIIIEK